MREYLGVRKQLGSPCMSGVRVGVHDATRRRSPHSAKQGHHSLSLREIELCIDHEPSAGVDEPGARMPRRCPVGDAGIDVVADFLELHASVNGRSGTLFGTSLACHPWPIYRDCAFIKSVSPSKRRKRQSTTVTAEALHWGFWHVGDFSKAYKECFGELPSDTLARAP